MHVPINRVVAFLGPYIAIVSGALADWALVHLHFLGIFHTSKDSITSFLTQAIVFGVSAGLVWLGHQKWLSGWQKWEDRIAGELFDGPVAFPDSGPYEPEKISPAPVPGKQS